MPSCVMQGWQHQFNIASIWFDLIRFNSIRFDLIWFDSFWLNSIQLNLIWFYFILLYLLSHLSWRSTVLIFPLDVEYVIYLGVYIKCKHVDIQHYSYNFSSIIQWQLIDNHNLWKEKIWSLPCIYINYNNANVFIMA